MNNRAIQFARQWALLWLLCAVLAAPVSASITRLTGASNASEQSGAVHEGAASNAQSAEARQQVQDILNQSRFSRWSPQKLEETKLDLNVDIGLGEWIWEQIKAFGRSLLNLWHYIADPLGQLFQDFWKWLKGLFPSPSSSPALPSAPGGWNFDFATIIRIVGWVLLAVVIVVLGVLLFKRMRATPRRGRSTRVLSREQVRSALETGEALALEGHEWVEQADKMLAEKDLRAVYRALYLAMLAGLHTAGKIDFRRTRTNWFYVRRFKGDEADRNIFGDLTELFDQVWYGSQPARIDEVSRVKAKVVSLVGEAALAPARESQSTNGGPRRA